MSSLRGSICFSPSPRATAVDLLLSNSELASCYRSDFERFWRVWLDSPRLQTLRLEFACSSHSVTKCLEYDGINKFIEYFINNVYFQNEHKVALTFHLSKWTELDDEMMSVMEVFESPVEIYGGGKAPIKYVEASMFQTPSSVSMSMSGCK